MSENLFIFLTRCWLFLLSINKLDYILGISLRQYFQCIHVAMPNHCINVRLNNVYKSLYMVNNVCYYESAGYMYSIITGCILAIDYK